jgi:hypothetical protein
MADNENIEEAGVIDEKPEERQLTPVQQLEERVDSMYVTANFTKLLKVEAGLRSLVMARAPQDYYSWTLE